MKSFQYAVAVAVAVGVTVLALGNQADAAVAQDKIESLPGWNGNLPTNQYSGYLTVQEGTKYLHYWFVESENDPSSDPVIAWFNGGPGCSSLGGFFTENGPFAVNATDSGPTLVERSTRWNKFANVVFIEAPAGVGFSYADSPSGYRSNDSITAENNYEAIQEFFSGYSEYRSHDFFVAGESYAGVYVPTLAHQILQRAGRNGDASINLKGIMVGNGCTGTDVGSCGGKLGYKYRSEYLARKGFISADAYKTVEKECINWENASLPCQKALAFVQEQVGAVNIYNIYGPCIISGEQPNSSMMFSETERKSFDLLSSEVGVKPQPGPLACINAGPTGAYLNQVAVRSAIHVSSESVTGKWTICTSKVEYEMTEKDEPKEIYPDLIDNYRVLIYNGDTDSCVPITDNESWTSGMNYPIKNKWRPWYVNQQVAGYVTEYEQGFSFLTVKGAGHMVPEFKPEQGYAMVQRFIQDQPF